MDSAKETTAERAEEVKGAATDLGETAKEKAGGAEAATEDKAAEVKGDKPAKPKFFDKVSSVLQQTGHKFTGLFSGAKEKVTPKK